MEEDTQCHKLKGKNPISKHFIFVVLTIISFDDNNIVLMYMSTSLIGSLTGQEITIRGRSEDLL